MAALVARAEPQARLAERRIVAKQFVGQALALSRAAIPRMRARGAGWIVNVGSVTAQAPGKPYGWFDANGGSSLYAAVKAALNRFTQGLAAECLASNIAVNLNRQHHFRIHSN